MSLFPFTATVNHTIAELQPTPPFRVGAAVTVLDVLPNKQFFRVVGHPLPIHVSRFDMPQEVRRTLRNEGIRC